MNILLQILKMRKKSLAAIAVLLVADVALYVFLSHFQDPRLEAMQDELLEKSQRQSTGSMDKSLIYSQGKKDLGIFDSRIPPKKDFMRVVGELFEIASNNGLSIGSVGYKPELIKDRDLLVYGLTFSVTGSYAGIKSFISDIGRSREILTIDHISLNSADSTPDSVKVSMRISAFFRTGKS